MDYETATIGDIQGGVPLELAEIEYKSFINTPVGTIAEQIASNLQSGVEELALPFEPNDKTLSICGSAPSLMDTLGEITGDVIAANRAIAVLQGAGIPVTYGMIWDASPEVVTHACVIRGKWLLASRVNPALIHILKNLGQSMALWHAAGDDDAPEINELLIGRPLVMGGATSVPRAIGLGHALGYRKFEVFGADSSCREGETHVGGSLRDENNVILDVDGKLFQTTLWMAKQANDWQETILPWCRTMGVTVNVHGDGLLPFVHRKWMERNAV